MTGTMRESFIRALSLGAACVIAISATGAHAALTISKQPTQNVNCSAGVCMATARRAVLNVTDLANMLAASNLTVESGSSAEDIAFVAPLSWASGNRLTLDAWRSMTFKALMTVSGPGALTVIANDGGTGGAFAFAGHGRVRFWDLNSSVVINGASYVLVGDIAGLASDIAGASGAGNYALADNYNARPDGTYPSAPIPTAFTGTLEGLGNAISNLSINDSTDQDVALFASLAGASARNIALLNAQLISSFTQTTKGVGVGVLAVVGSAFSISHVTVTGSTQSVARYASMGGIIGTACGGALESSSSAVSVTANGNNGYLGGLVGGECGSSPTTISNSSASGNIAGRFSARAGGLIGNANIGTTISHCRATGSVSGTGSGELGGLAGLFSYGTITLSSASGNIIAGTTPGGAVGGGLAGNMFQGDISQSFATGTVSGVRGGDMGGLVGSAGQSTISQSYATGAVSSANATGNAGGLVGLSNAMVSQSYSTGATSGGSSTQIGGFIGDDFVPGQIASAYWDLNTSGISDPGQGAGTPRNDPGITGLTTAQFQSGLPSGFDSNVWAQSPGINNGYPYLIANPPPRAR